MRILVLSLLLAVTLSPSATACYGQAAVPEYQLKSAVLVKFLEFTTWPPGTFKPDSSFQIGVLGDDVYGEHLNRAVANPVAGRKIEVKRSNTLADLQGCQLVVISPALADKDRVAAITALSKTSTLTVSDRPGFAESGGMIEMFIEGKRVKFNINEASAKGAGVKIDARLLNLAKSVIR